jgi:hypothetical protein
VLRTLKVRINQTRIGKARSRVALALLFLVAHASLQTATHHHATSPAIASAFETSISSRESESPNGTPGSSDSSHCATCRLQRNFSSALRSPSVSFALSPATVSFEVFQREARSLGALVVFSGRAPPSV